MYPSKILIFGEYTILAMSDALAIPFNRFNGELDFMDNVNEGVSSEQEKSNRILASFLSFIKNTTLKNKTTVTFDFEAFEKDTKNGLYFKSDIPEGSGLGSSGALVAAIFHKYTNVSLNTADLALIKNDLALMESFFHGKSSGIDPLVSLLNSPLLIREKEIRKIPACKIEKKLREYGLFLVFSRRVSGTIELVAKFRSRCMSDIEYLNKIYLKYIPINNRCIRAVSDISDRSAFFQGILELTAIQTEIFEDMIPEDIALMINHGRAMNLFYLKLCGSGGGGYFLGFTKNISLTKEYFNTKGFKILVY